MANSEQETSGPISPAPINRAETFRNDEASPTLANQGNEARRSMYFWKRAKEEATGTRTTYAYKDIDYGCEIRVLTIYPGGANSPLECRLSSCPLLEGCRARKNMKVPPIKYTALSYYWGTDMKKHKVYLFEDDEAHNFFTTLGETARKSLLSYICIQKNLNNALRQLRSETEEVHVWADALCINQEYTEERTAQVSRMHDVYLQAEEVCIWLGDAVGKEVENHQTFELLRDILDLEKLDQFIARLKQKQPPALEACNSVIKLMKSDWFKRRWVIQELALATRPYVRCGEEVMTWTEFGDAIALFMTKHALIRRVSDGKPKNYSSSRNPDEKLMAALDARALGANSLVTTTSNLFRKTNEGKIQQRLLTLEQLVSSMLLAFEASDPKDTIFAVLRIAKDSVIPEDLDDMPHPWLLSTLMMGSSAIVIPLIAMLVWYFSAVMHKSRTNISITGIPTATPATLASVPSKPRLAGILLTWIMIVLLSVLLIWLISRSAVDKVSNYLTTAFGGAKTKRKLVDNRIEPNYEKRTIDVYADFIEYCVETSNSLDIICRHWAPTPAEDEHGRKPHIPTWILPLAGHAYGGPKAESRANGDSLVGGVSGKSNYSASGGIPPEFKFGRIKQGSVGQSRKRVKQTSGKYTEKSVQVKKIPLPQFDGSLNVQGFPLGEIVESSQIIGGLLNEGALAILGWERGKHVSEAEWDQLWRTLVANRGPDGTNAPNWYRIACKACLKWHEEQLDTFFNTNTLARLEGTPDGKVKFLDRVQQVIWDRICFQATMKGGKKLVGLAPPKAQVGHLVCIIYGCSVPIVLKRVGKNFHFIGECYVHGMMDGEAVYPIPKYSLKQNFRLV